MDVQSLQALLTPAGQDALAQAQARQPKEADYLAHFQALSRRCPPALAQAALEIAIQRGRAGEKFPYGEKLYFTREALEQASAYAVAAWRARRYREYSTVLDMACSAGGDALALAERGGVIGVDRDALRLGLAQANLRAVGLAGRCAWLQADLRQLPLDLSHVPADWAAFFDPARRQDGRRVYTVERYTPPLSTLRAWLPALPATGVKLSPGVKLDELAAYDGEIEFISLDGELKECALWLGPLRTARRRATLLPSGEFFPPGNTLAVDSLDELPKLPLSEPQEWLYEPDPAVLRAGLVTLLGAQLGAAQLDPDIAYLTGAQRQETPFARRWRVEDWMPFQLKRLRVYLRERGIGQVTVKKRGSPLQPEALIRQLRLRGENEATLFLTHLRGQPVVIIAQVDG
jgi:SAM-dependent methyltransferase